MLNAMRRSKERRLTAERIYAALVTRARQPVFFERFAVSDTFDGRFDLLALHAWLVLAGLKKDAQLSQALVDAIFVGFEEALREMGAGDMGMGRRVKKFADAFYGRLKAYDDAKDASEMAAALERNLYRGRACDGQMVDYVMQTRDRLASLANGAPDFGPLPGEE